MMEPNIGDVLAGLLSADGIQRNAAEEKLALLKSGSPAFGLTLTEIVIGLGHEKPLAQRQLACTLLKQYIETHWSPPLIVGDGFALMQPNDEIKARIRKILPFSLKDAQKCIRTGGAYAIASIAKFDWPDKWPQLFDTVGNALKSNTPDLVDGAMNLLSELVNTVSMEQMQNMEHFLLSELLNIFTHSESFSLEMRTRAVIIFNSISLFVFAMTKSDAKAPMRLGYFFYLNRFSLALINALSDPDDGQISDIALKTEVIKVLATTVEKFPKQMQKMAPRILPHVGQMLMTNSELYSRMVVEGDDEIESAVDSEALEQFIYALIEFIHAVTGDKRFSQQMIDAIPELIFQLIICIQIPEEKVEEWSKDIHRYVEDEDIEASVVSVRMSAIDLAMNLAESYPVETITALWAALTRHMTLSATRKEAEDPNWWKIREACYTAIGSVSTTLVTVLAEMPSIVNMGDFLIQVLLPDVSISGPTFLQGHGLSLAGRLCPIYGQSIMEKFLKLCSEALSPDCPYVIRICACRAFYNICEEAKNLNADLSTVCDLKSVISSLVALGVRTSESVLNLVLSTLTIVLENNPSAGVSSKVIPLVTAALIKYSGDPVIPSQAAEIVRILMTVPECREQIEKSLLPTIFSIIKREDKSALPIRLPAVSLEVFESIVRGSPRPLSNLMIGTGFPAVVNCMLSSDDSHTLAAGRECVRAFISKAADQVVAWNDGTNNGVSLIVKIVCHLLSPSSPEISASMVGRLIFVLLKRANEAIAPYLEQILHAVLCKMYASELSSVHQSLIMVFAHLVHYQLEPVIQFLSSVSTPVGTSALFYVLILWCEKQKAFFGSYDQKVSSLALCKVFLYAVNSPNSALREMNVPNISDSSEAASAQQPPSIPLLVKILKLLIYELDSQLEIRFKTVACTEDAHESNDENEDDTVFDGENGGGDSKTGGDVAEMLKDIICGMQGGDDDISDENDDPDVADDAISGMDLLHELNSFLTQLTQQPYYQELYQHLNDSERTVLLKTTLTH